MVVYRLPYRGKPRKGGPQTPLRCAQNAAFCKAFASAAGSRSYRRRKAGAPVGGASASAGANALSAKGGVSVYGQVRPQKCEKNGFRKRTSRARRGRNASVKGLRRPPQDGTARFCGRRHARPPQPALSFLREKFSRAVLSFAGHLMRNQKRRRTDGAAAAPQDGKPPAKTRRTEAAVRRGPLRRNAHAGRRKSPRREGFPSRSTRPRRANRPRRRAARRTGKADVFRPLRLVKEGAFSKPLRGRGFARLLRKANRKRDKARADRLGGRKRVPQTRMRGKVRAGGPPDGPRTPAVTSGLRADRLFYSNCKGRFSSLFFSILIMLIPNPPRTARRKRQEGRFFLEDHH